MKLPHARPFAARLAAMIALAQAFRGGPQGVIPDPVSITRDYNTSHGGRLAFQFDRRRAHLRRMKARRSHA